MRSQTPAQASRGPRNLSGGFARLGPKEQIPLQALTPARLGRCGGLERFCERQRRSAYTTAILMDDAGSAHIARWRSSQFRRRCI